MTFQPQTVRARLLADDGGRAHGQHREGEVSGTARADDELASNGSDVNVTGTGKVLGSFRRRRQRFRLQRRLSCYVSQKMTKIFYSLKSDSLSILRTLQGEKNHSVFLTLFLFLFV